MFQGQEDRKVNKETWVGGFVLEGITDMAKTTHHTIVWMTVYRCGECEYKLPNLSKDGWTVIWKQYKWTGPREISTSKRGYWISRHFIRHRWIETHMEIIEFKLDYASLCRKLHQSISLWDVIISWKFLFEMPDLEKQVGYTDKWNQESPEIWRTIKGVDILVEK